MSTWRVEVAELRARKGVTIEEARKQMNHATYFATMMSNGRC